MVGCATKPKSDKLKLYYVGINERMPGSDTSDYFKWRNIDTLDEVVGQVRFRYNNMDHALIAYTSDNHAPTDGGSFYYTLDTLGIIYDRSTTWPGFSVLQSNNDSLNNLIAMALGRALRCPRLRYDGCFVSAAER